MLTYDAHYSQLLFCVGEMHAVVGDRRGGGGGGGHALGGDKCVEIKSFKSERLILLA
jgi:hypothetical protein